MMTIIQSFILGVVEGVTEFLPVSSTGHLILASELLKISENDFLKSFDIIIQLGAILSVVVVYWRSFLSRDTLQKLIVGFIPTGIIGFALYKVVKTYLLGNDAVVLISLFVGGLLLVLFELWHHEPAVTEEPPAVVSYKQAFIMGVCQSLAIIPGISRSAATIVGGLALGLPRTLVVQFSFLLAVPTMLAASGLDLIKNSEAFSSDQLAILAVGLVVSFLVALASIKFLLGYIRKHTFIPFGVYRMIIAVLFWLIVLR